MSDQFTTQPAPSDPPQEGGGLRSGADGAAGAFSAKGPHIPNQDILNTLDKPLSKEELEKRQKELNQ